MKLKPRKKKPNEHLQKELLFQQANKCFYCGQEFFTFGVLRTGVIRFLHPVFDHVKPWSKYFSNNPNNFVASCESCNSAKSDKDFANARSAKKHISKFKFQLHPQTRQHLEVLHALSFPPLTFSDTARNNSSVASAEELTKSSLA